MSERRKQALRYFEEQKSFLSHTVPANIEANRKSAKTVAFVDGQGNPLKEVSFTAEQISQDFKFGCNLFLLDEFETEEKNKLFRKLFPSMFNYGIVPFYWADLEPEQGKPRYDKNSPKVYRRPAPDLVVEFCREQGIEMKGHCLVYDAFAPGWLSKEPDKIRLAIDRHFQEIGERYGESIRDWDIINETLSWNWDGMERETAFFREDDYLSYSFDCAARHLCANRNFVNDAVGIWDHFHGGRSWYALLIKDLLHRGVRFDGIGIQCHQFVPREGEADYAAKCYNPRRIYDVLDTYGQFGKPVQISEVTICSYNGDQEDMEIQAELLKQVYRVWFSHRAMDGIVYWNLADEYTYVPGGAQNYDPNTGENQFGGALLYHDLSPKPAWKALDELIHHEWHTKGSFHTAEDSNRAEVYGFRGCYLLTLEYRGKRY